MNSNPLNIREQYNAGSLDEQHANPDPVLQLQTWILQADQAGIREPNGMTVSTVTIRAGVAYPSSRVVLLRGLDANGLLFFTNYASRKGTQFVENPAACVNFWWPEAERQVRVEGMIERIHDHESDAYFASRPYESQAASAASPQSQPITRVALEQLVLDIKRDQPNQIVRPAHWGGFRIKPDYFEFWQGRPARLHDRLTYSLKNNSWVLGRIAP